MHQSSFTARHPALHNLFIFKGALTTQTLAKTGDCSHFAFLLAGKPAGGSDAVTLLVLTFVLLVFVPLVLIPLVLFLLALILLDGIVFPMPVVALLMVALLAVILLELVLFASCSKLN